MKKLFLFTMVAALTVMNSFGQGEVRFGVKGGLNLASIGGDAVYAGFGGFDSRVSFHIGGLVEVPFTDKISVQPEVLFSSQGSKYNFGTSGITDTKLSYINFPVMGKYHIIEGLSGELGPVVGVLLKADGLDSDTGIEGDVKDQYKNIDVGVGIGATYRFPMGVFGSLRYNKGVTNINDDSNVNGKNQNNVFQVSAGYTF